MAAFGDFAVGLLHGALAEGGSGRAGGDELHTFTHVFKAKPLGTASLDLVMQFMPIHSTHERSASAHTFMMHAHMHASPTTKQKLGGRGHTERDRWRGIERARERERSAHHHIWTRARKTIFAAIMLGLLFRY